MDIGNFLVKYDKTPKFCEVCGILGHEFMECGMGFHAPESHECGEFLIAETGRHGRGWCHGIVRREDRRGGAVRVLVVAMEHMHHGRTIRC
jgi:hypothetical protein